MPFPLVAAPPLINGITLLVGGLLAADSINQSANRIREGFSESQPTQSLGGTDLTSYAPNSIGSMPAEDSVWDGRSTATGALSDKLADSRKQTLRDSYMPLVGAAPKTVTPQGKSSSVTTPRAKELTRAKLAPQLGSAADLVGGAFAMPSSAVAAVARGFSQFPKLPSFGTPLLDNLIKEKEKLAQAIDAARVDSSPAKNPPPFTGGQMVGQQYIISWVFYWVHSNFAPGGRSYPSGERFITGPIGIRDTYVDVGNGTKGGGIYITSGGTNLFSNGETNQGVTSYNLNITSLRRADGQPDTGGNPPSLIPDQEPTIPAPYPPASEWLYGSPLVTVGGNAAKMLDKMQAAAPMPIMKGDPNASPDNLGLPTATNPEIAKSPSGFNAVPSSTPSTPSTPSAPSAPSANSGFVSVPATQTPATQVYANGMTNESYNKGALPDFKQVPPSATPQYSKGSQVAPNPPASKAPEQFTIPSVSNEVALIGSTLLAVNAVAQKVNTIESNTTPQAQQTNAKQGVCDAMQPQQCGFEGVKQATAEATEPIKDQTVANAGLLAQVLAALANLASTIANLFSNVVGKLDGIKEFLEKVARAAKLDKVYNLLTFITVIHNAQMLSNSLATTLMDSLSLGLATFGVKDENESPIDIQQIINKSTEDAVKGIIGTANYTTLTERWAKAVRVYQAAANITYQVRSLWDSARSLNELTGSNVGKIGNALRRDGVVAENAYGAMADNPLAVNSAMTKLQNLDEAASHLNSITSETYGVTETVAQIKKDQDDFKKLVKEGTSSTTPIVNDQQKAKDDAAKLASVSPPIATTDLAKPD